MLLSREGDRREAILLRQGKGWSQVPSGGHEAIAALGLHLNEQDYIFPAYRDRALMHVRGMSVEEMALDYLARSGSSSEGRNLPCHFSSRRLNVFSVTSPVGSQCPPAVGVAIGIQRAQPGAIVLCHIGDAATRQGEFYEAVCLAQQEALPILFVVEDNGYGISTPTDMLTPRALGVFAKDLITTVDGRDAETVYTTGGQVIERIRHGGGPHILWCEVDRLGNHTNADDQRVYRPMDELEAIERRDPVDRLAAWMLGEGVICQADLEGAKSKVVNDAAHCLSASGRGAAFTSCWRDDPTFTAPASRTRPCPLVKLRLGARRPFRER